MRDFPGAALLIAGSGSLNVDPMPGAGRQVIVIGHLPSYALEQYYRHAIATLLPSHAYETFRLTLVESSRTW